MPIRNPFARRPGPAAAPADEAVSPRTAEISHTPGFQRVDTVGSGMTSSTLSIRSGRSARSIDTGDYKMSVVNDSGIYLPPSPSDATSGGLWPRKYLSQSSIGGGRNSTDTHASLALGEIEPFGISRESFDSYRRSFDVSARTPIPQVDALPPRTSLDSSSVFARLPRSAMDSGRRPQFIREMMVPPEEFEDVGLEDKAAPQQTQQQQQGRRRGFFAKFTTATESNTGSGAAVVPQEGLSKWIGGGRKRASSNAQGSELKPMESPKEGDREEELEAEEKEKGRAEGRKSLEA